MPVKLTKEYTPHRATCRNDTVNQGSLCRPPMCSHAGSRQEKEATTYAAADALR